MLESVVEDLDVKKDLFRALDLAVKDEAILATNTSTLPVVELAMVTERPERVCGIHFFNPAPAMSLVEVVRPLTASDETISHAREFAESCGKEPVEVKDRAGFIVNALLFPYLNNAVRMLETGTATRDDIDSAMKGGCNFPMGPLGAARPRRPRHVARHPRRALRRVPRSELRRGPDAAAHGDRRPPRPEVEGRLLRLQEVAGLPVDVGPSKWDLPPAEAADEHGIVGIGADLEPSTLLAAYRRGIFPMPVQRGGPMGWWSPDPRAIVPLDGLRVSRSLRKSCSRFEIRVDTAFARRDRRMRRSAPAWRAGSRTRSATPTSNYTGSAGPTASRPGRARTDSLCGGLYGVAIGGLFAGESMFHRRTDASKVALVGLVERLHDAGPAWNRARGPAARRAVAHRPSRHARRRGRVAPFLPGPAREPH